MATPQQFEDVDLVTPSGQKVTVNVPKGWSDDQIRTNLRVKNPELFAKPDNSQPTQFEKDNSNNLAQTQANIRQAQGYKNLQSTQFERQQNNLNPFADPAATQADIGRAINPTAQAAFQKQRSAALSQISSNDNIANMAGESVYPGGGQVAQGALNLGRGDIAKGGHQVISGAMEAGSTLLPFGFRGLPAALRVGAGLTAGAGGSAAGNYVAKSAGASPDQAALVGDLTGLTSGGLAAGAMPGKAAPMSKDAAVSQISDAINPSPKEIDVPKFRADLNQHLDTILQTAKSKGIAVTKGVSGLAEATEATAKDAHDFYMNKMVKPIANDEISVPSSVNVGNSKVTLTAKVGDIVGRLKEINDTLAPKYTKGGLAAQAAIGAEQAAPLRAEAATLRATLNDYMAKRLDMPIEQVAAMRQNMGSLRQLGEDIQFYSDQARHTANSAKNAPINLETNAAGLAARGAQNVARKAFGNPADRAVSKAVSNYKPQAVTRPTPTIIDKTQAPSYQPSWMKPGTESPLSVSGNFPTNDTGTPVPADGRYY